MGYLVTGINNYRVMVTVPVADVAGCYVANPLDCCPVGSGSGSGSGHPGAQCITGCPPCGTPVSTVWNVIVPPFPLIMLFHVDDPNDGNYCRWVSADLNWQLEYSAFYKAWILTDYLSDNIWVLQASLFNCQAANTMGSGSAAFANATVTPAYACGGGGSGSGGTGCPTPNVNLTAHVSVLSNCPCITAPFTVTLIPQFPPSPGATLSWFGTSAPGTCGVGLDIVVSCINGTLYIVVWDGEASTMLPPDSVSPTPYTATWNVVHAAYEGCPMGQLKLVVTQP